MFCIVPGFVTRMVLFWMVNSLTSVQKTLPPLISLFENLILRAGSGPPLPEIETAVTGVSCFIKFESIIISGAPSQRAPDRYMNRYLEVSSRCNNSVQTRIQQHVERLVLSVCSELIDSRVPAL